MAIMGLIVLNLVLLIVKDAYLQLIVYHYVKMVFMALIVLKPVAQIV